MTAVQRTIIWGVEKLEQLSAQADYRMLRRFARPILCH
jgi:hypothetical protein